MGKFHPAQAAYQADPYPYLARLRCTERGYYSPEMQGYILTRYEDCAAVLKDDEHFSSDPATSTGGMGDSVREARTRTALGDTPILANTDGDTHDRLRRVLAEAFRPANVNDLQAPMAQLAGNLLASVRCGEPFEVMETLAQPMPVIVLLNFLGIPPAYQDVFRACVVAVMRGRMEADHSAEAARVASEALEVLRRMLSDACAEDPAGVLGRLHDAVGGGDLSEDEMVMLLVHVATAGNAATAFAIGGGLLALARNPGAWAVLRETPELVPMAVEECFRYDCPTHITERFTKAGAEVGGRRLPPGRTVHLVLGAANRDPAAFPNPDTFELGRRRGHQLAFGLGPHFCLGGALARLEIGAAFNAMLERFEDLEVVPNGYIPGGTLYLRGPRRLMVKAG